MCSLRLSFSIGSWVDEIEVRLRILRDCGDGDKRGGETTEQTEDHGSHGMGLVAGNPLDPIAFRGFRDLPFVPLFLFRPLTGPAALTLLFILVTISALFLSSRVHPCVSKYLRMK